MFIIDYNGWELKNAKKVTMACPHCGNNSEHSVYVAPKGIQVGLAFLKKPLLGKRQYYLACPICGNLSKELSKEQAFALRQ